MVRLPYVELIRMKRWADQGLCEAVGRNLDQLGEQAPIMLLVLDHIHTVDRIFQHHLQGRPHSYRAARSETLPTFEALAEGMRDADDWLAAYAEGLSPEDFDQRVDFVFTSGKPASMRRSEILLHLCLHGAYHRGNAGALLQLRGLTPSRDAITDYLEDAA